MPGTANRFFYRQELMQSTVIDTSPIIAIVGRCAVLDYREYTTRKMMKFINREIVYLNIIFILSFLSSTNGNSRK